VNATKYGTLAEALKSEINRLAREKRYILRFGEVFSVEMSARIRELAAELIRSRAGGVIYQPLEGDASVSSLSACSPTRWRC